MDGIVLLAKTPGITSFSSLFNVKKALNTNKVGHTGTLDSFAQGLLVVCTGRYTRLVSKNSSSTLFLYVFINDSKLHRTVLGVILLIEFFSAINSYTLDIL